MISECNLIHEIWGMYNHEKLIITVTEDWNQSISQTININFFIPIQLL
jgi:hypothetical protein